MIQGWFNLAEGPDRLTGLSLNSLLLIAPMGKQTALGSQLDLGGRIWFRAVSYWLVAVLHPRAVGA